MHIYALFSITIPSRTRTHALMGICLLFIFVAALILESSCDPLPSMALMFWLDAISLVSPRWHVIIYCCCGLRADTLINQCGAIFAMLFPSAPHMGSLDRWMREAEAKLTGHGTTTLGLLTYPKSVHNSPKNQPTCWFSKNFVLFKSK